MNIMSIESVNSSRPYFGAENALSSALDLPNLRIVALGPDLDLSEVYDLGGKTFLIGRQGCHLNLPRAAIPQKALRIRAAEKGLSFEGIGLFRVPLDGITVLEGRIESGRNLVLQLDPYELIVEPCRESGRPIELLDEDVSMPAGAPGLSGAAVPDESPAQDDPLDKTLFSLDARLPVPDLKTVTGGPVAGAELSWIGEDGPCQGQVCRIARKSMVIGRTTGDLRIADGRVSSKHAQLDVLGQDLFLLKDLASTNGTTVNGRRISTASLSHGDRVSFAGVGFRFVVKPEER